MKNFSFFEVETGYADELIGALNNKKYMRRTVAVEVAQEKSDKPRLSGFSGRKTSKWPGKRSENRKQRVTQRTF